MALTSIVLAFAAGLCTSLGVLTTPFPVVGSAFSFAAPALAILGIALGARAMGRARAEQRRSLGGLLGVVLNAMALAPALGVALTCGAFNAALTHGGVQTTTTFQLSRGQGAAAGPDAVGAPPPPFAPGLLGPDGGSGVPDPSAPSAPTAAPGSTRGEPEALPSDSRPLPPPPLPPE